MSTPLRVLLVDDEPLALRRLSRALRTVPDVEVVGSAGDGDAALDEARRLAPDLIILDVEMPGRDGLAVAVELSREGGPEIVIQSAFDHYAAAAFEVEAVDYLLKPLRHERLRQALDRARRRHAERAAHVLVSAPPNPPPERAVLRIPDRHGGYDVPLSEVIWVEAARDYALIHTSTRTHILRVTMTELAGTLPCTLLRVHRSAFVSLAHVRRWGTPQRGVHGLVLSDGDQVAVGPSYLQDVRAALRSLDRRV